jgi:uncharacterized Zn-finger protein
MIADTEHSNEHISKKEQSDMAEIAEKPQAPQSTIVVSRKDLPLSCPRPEDEVWNMHPRVYLPIEKTGKATCPYCGAQYRLDD